MRILLIAALASLSAGAALAADPVEGDWMVGRDTKVHVAPCASRPDQMCGVIVWLKTPNDKSGQPLRDKSNPDPALRSRALVGLPFISGFHRAEPGRWTGGKIYDPDSGKTYASKMQLDPGGVLKVSGCVLLFCQAQSWRRAE